jgi:hypothetical protein
MMADDTEKKPSIFDGLKIDFPALLAINIFATFAAVIILCFFVKIPVDGPLGNLLEVLKNIVLLMVGFYFGSSAGSKTKDDSQNKIVEKLTATAPPGPPGPVAPVSAEPVPWWSRLTDEERTVIETHALTDTRAATFMIAAKAGTAETSDLAYVVTKGWITQARASEIVAS